MKIFQFFFVLVFRILGRLYREFLLTLNHLNGSGQKRRCRMISRKLVSLIVILFLFVFGMTANIFAQTRVDTVGGWHGPYFEAYYWDSLWTIGDSGYIALSDKHIQGQHSLELYVIDGDPPNIAPGWDEVYYKKYFGIPTPDTLFMMICADSASFKTEVTIGIKNDTVWSDTWAYDFGTGHANVYPDWRWCPFPLHGFGINPPPVIDTLIIEISWYSEVSNGNGIGWVYVDSLVAKTNGIDTLLDPMEGGQGIEESSIKTSAPFLLYQNSPNPFSQLTTISYQVNKPSRVNLEIYDPTGRVVDILKNKKEDRGYHTVRWNRKNIVSGIYFYRLQVEEYSETKKMVLIE